MRLQNQKQIREGKLLLFVYTITPMHSVVSIMGLRSKPNLVCHDYLILFLFILVDKYFFMFFASGWIVPGVFAFPSLIDSFPSNLQATAQAINLSANTYFVPDLRSQAYLNYGAALSEVKPWPFSYICIWSLSNINWSWPQFQVEVDLLTGATTVLRTDLCYDCGKSLSLAVDLGQVCWILEICVSFITEQEYESTYWKSCRRNQVITATSTRLSYSREPDACWFFYNATILPEM